MLTRFWRDVMLSVKMVNGSSREAASVAINSPDSSAVVEQGSPWTPLRSAGRPSKNTAEQPMHPSDRGF